MAGRLKAASRRTFTDSQVPSCSNMSPQSLLVADELLERRPAAEHPETTVWDPVARSKFIRLAVTSLLFVAACAFSKLTLSPIIVFLYFVVLAVQRRTDVGGLLAIWLLAGPFLGPYITIQLGVHLGINFNRLMIILLVVMALAERGGSKA